MFQRIFFQSILLVLTLICWLCACEVSQNNIQQQAQLAAMYQNMINYFSQHPTVNANQAFQDLLSNPSTANMALAQRAPVIPAAAPAVRVSNVVPAAPAYVVPAGLAHVANVVPAAPLAPMIAPAANIAPAPAVANIAPLANIAPVAKAAPVANAAPVVAVKPAEIVDSIPPAVVVPPNQGVVSAPIKPNNAVAPNNVEPLQKASTPAENKEISAAVPEVNPNTNNNVPAVVAPVESPPQATAAINTIAHQENASADTAIAAYTTANVASNRPVAQPIVPVSTYYSSVASVSATTPYNTSSISRLNTMTPTTTSTRTMSSYTVSSATHSTATTIPAMSAGISHADSSFGLQLNFAIAIGVVIISFVNQLI